MKGAVLTGLAVGALAVAGSASAQVAGVQTPGTEIAQFAPTQLLDAGLLPGDQQDSGLARTRTEYAPLGVRTGGLTINPALTLGAGYDDNVFAHAAGEGDEAFTASPSVSITSNWSRHAIDAFAMVNSRTYIDHTALNATDWRVGANGRIDLAKNLAIGVGGSYEAATEDRTSPSTPASAIDPVTYDFGVFYLGAVKQINRLRLSGDVEVRDYSYDNVRGSFQPTLLEDFRDHTETRYGGRAEFALSPDVSVYVDAAGNHRDYSKVEPGNPSRTSSGYDVDFGTSFAFARLARGEIAIGYLNQSYDDSSYKNVSGFGLRGFFEYYLNELTTLRVDASQSVEDAAIVGSSGYLLTTGEISVARQLRNNLILTAAAGYSSDDFKGIDRSDSRPYLDLSAHFLINRSLGVVGGYKFMEQSSSGSMKGTNFTVNRVFVSLVYQL